MVEILKGILGSFFLIGATDMIGRLFWKREDGLSGRWLSWLVSFFTIVTPLFYILNLLKLQINYYSVVSILILIWFGTGIIFRRKIFEFEKIKIKEILFWLLAYFAIHLIFYSIYFTIPEWDSYRNIASVRENIVSGSIVSNYRPFFDASMTIFSVVTSVDPYIIFPFILIIAQSSLLFSIYLISKDNKNKIFRSLLLASTIAVPVINMEIDMPRAQNILLVLMPVFFYFLNRFYLSKESVGDLVLILWISVIGISYHEFFLSLVLLVGIICIKRMISSWVVGDKKDKTIIVLLLVVAILTALLAFNYLFTLRAIIGNFQIIINNFLNKFEWKWWFIGKDISADNMSVAWVGWKSIAMYYAYYLSPIIAGWILLLIYSIIKNRKLDHLHYSLIVVGGIFFTFAEILPRMNIGILPERSWLFFDVTLLIFISSYAKKIRLSSYIKSILCVLIIISIAGSFFVAIGKKSLTSSKEMKAAIWIKDNTPKNSVFISQQANNQLIGFFGTRKIISPNEDYFLSDKIIEINEVNICESDLINLEIVHARDEISNFDIIYGNVKNLVETVNSSRKKINKFKSTCYPTDIFTNSPKYVLYSLNKLEGLYSTREWWQDVNYFGANLEKFNAYPLVYDQDGVKIWRLK